MDDNTWMRYALSLAKQALEQDEVPVGAVIVLDNKLIATGFNCSISACDTTAHAEIQAIRTACRNLQNYRLTGSTLYVTLEPCAMCAGAIIHARINRVVFGTFDPRTGSGGSIYNILQDPRLNHQASISSGNMEAECSQILKDFFKTKREKTTC